MSRLRQIALIPAASWTERVVVGLWVLMLVILSRCQQGEGHGGDTVMQEELLEGIKVRAVRTARPGSAGRLRGDRDQRQSRQHTVAGRHCARQDQPRLEREVST